MPLQDTEIESLEQLLFSDDISEDTLDYFGWHGLITASVIGPKPISEDNLIRITFGDDQPALNDEQRALFSQYAKVVQSDLVESLNHGNPITLPYEDEDLFEEALESWCAGFMEGFFYAERNWFTKGEDVTAELLLPIMALSGLFEEEEFQEIRDNDKIMAQFEEQLHDLLVDIYLFYHAE